MKHVARIVLLTLALTALIASFSLFSQIQFSVAAGQTPYPPPDFTDGELIGEPYPPPSSPDQLFPYPPPALGEYTSPSSNIDTAQMDEALIEDAKMYASASGVSFDDAIERLMLQGIVEGINIKLKTGESSTFAGLWIQHKPDYRVIVRFTNNGNTTIKPYIQNTSLADIVEAQTADVSLEELRSV